MNIEQIYKDANALLEGHFKLSSGNHSQFYLQSAKVLEDPKTAKLLAEALAAEIADEIMTTVQPEFVRVALTQRPRGGIEVHAEVERNR